MELLSESFFLGEFEHTLDTQRRVAIPSAWRGGDGACHFFLIPSKNRFLQMLSASAFKEMLLDKVKNISLADGKASLDLAKLGSRAQECVCDKQGRIQLSQKLAEHANLTDKVILVGAIGYAQLWSPEAWRENQGGIDDCYAVIDQLSGN